MPLSKIARKVLARKAGKASWKKGKAHFTAARARALAKARASRKVKKKSLQEFADEWTGGVTLDQWSKEFKKAKKLGKTFKPPKGVKNKPKAWEKVKVKKGGKWVPLPGMKK